MELSSNESMFIWALLMPSMDLHMVTNHLDRDFLWREVLHIQQHRKIPRVRGHLGQEPGPGKEYDQLLGSKRKVVKVTIRTEWQSEDRRPGLVLQ